MLAAEYARQGKDWETELRQRAKEQALMKELGLTSSTPAPGRTPEPCKETGEESASQLIDKHRPWMSTALAFS